MCIFTFIIIASSLFQYQTMRLGKDFKKKTRIGYDMFFVRKNFVVENLLFEQELHLLKKYVSLK